MCLFHKWEEAQKGVVTLCSYSIFSKNEIERERMLIIEKCKKCGKKRAYLYSPFYPENKKEIDIFYAENALKDK